MVDAPFVSRSRNPVFKSMLRLVFALLVRRRISPEVVDFQTLVSAIQASSLSKDSPSRSLEFACGWIQGRILFAAGSGTSKDRSGYQ